VPTAELETAAHPFVYCSSALNFFSSAAPLPPPLTETLHRKIAQSKMKIHAIQIKPHTGNQPSNKIHSIGKTPAG
jgi:hypothetical protein